MKEVFQANFGGRLKAAREAGNLTVSDVAAKLKLTNRQIEALEQEDFGSLPSEIFVRGFVRNYARLVGIEPESLIAPVDVQAAVSETITAPNAGLNVGSSSLRQWLIYPMLAAALFLLLVAGLYHWLRQGEDTLVSAMPETTEQQVPVLPPPPLVPPVAPDIVTQLASPQPIEDAPAPLPVEVPPEVNVKPTAPEFDETVRNADANVKTGLRSMRFEPAQDAWIQVVDAKGTRFSKLVRAGSAESFAGEPPFRLVVGEAALVKLTYNGHSIDLTPFIGQKVARLTLE